MPGIQKEEAEQYMTEPLQWTNYDEDDPYPLTEPDRLGVLSSTRNVVEQGEYVWINREQVELLATQFIASDSRMATNELQGDAHTALNTTLPAFSWYDRYHFHDGTERTVNWLLVLDALNFCFWAEKDSPRWRIEYQGEPLNGYWAEAAALTRAVEEGIPLWDAEYLSTMSSDALEHIFRGEEMIPLFEHRLQNVHEVGRVLLERFEGQFARAIEQAQGSAVQLVSLLTKNFSSFYDVASYRACEVRFFKRAQICVADLFGSFDGKSWGAFYDLDKLTAFADYKLPQVLRHFEVLEYDPILAERIDNQELLEQGGEEEVELRAATVWACELLRREMTSRGHPITAAEIDQRLWLLGQNVTGMRPYHRTRTIYY
jgi:Potential Queuosine, Q, salvage protein family